MAIDATIPLQLKSPQLVNPLDLAQQAQAISSARTAQQTAQAQLPQIEAQAALKQREAAAAQYWMTNKDKFTKVDPKDPTKKSFDYVNAIDSMASAGFAPEATMLMHEHLATASKQVKNADDYVGLLQKSAGWIGQVLSQTPVDQHGRIVQSAAVDLNKLMPGSADLLFGKPDVQGTYPVPPQQALEAAGLTPAQSEDLAVKRGGLTGPAARDTGSAVVKDAYAKLNAAGLNPAPGQTYPQLMADATNAAVLQSNVISAPAKQTAIEKQNHLFSLQQVANKGSGAGQSLLDDIKYKFSPTDLLGNLITKYLTEPRFQVLAAALDEYEKDTGVKLDRKFLSIGAATQLLKEWNRSKLTPEIKTQRNLQKGVRYSDIQTSPETTESNQLPPTLTKKDVPSVKGKVPMLVNGKVVQVDPAHVNALKNRFNATEIK